MHASVPSRFLLLVGPHQLFSRYAGIGGTGIAVQATIISGQQVSLSFDLAGRFNLLRHVSINFYVSGRQRAVELGAITQSSRDFCACKLFDKRVKRSRTAIKAGRYSYHLACVTTKLCVMRTGISAIKIEIGSSIDTREAIFTRVLRLSLRTCNTHV